MAIIDLVSWEPQRHDHTVYAHRFPETNLSTYTQLIVAESQEALLFNKGRLMGKFGPGKHTLNTENLPILRSIFGIPFGGKNPFTAEVWFVNKVRVFNIDWRITRLLTHDPDYNTQIPLYASGQYGLQVTDAEKFLINFVGTRHEFTQTDMTEQSRGEFTSKAKSVISQFIIQNRVGVKHLGAYMDQISEFLRQQTAPFWNDLGLELTKFYVNEIDIDDSTPEGQQIRQALATQSTQSITGHTWQQEQMFSTANNAIGSMGSGSMGSGSMGSGSGSLLGGIMAINMMNGMMGGASNRPQNPSVGADMMQPQYSQPSFGGHSNPTFTGQPQSGGYPTQAPATTPQPQQPKMVYCSNCGKKYPSTSAFCPNCGNKYNPCPNCGTDNNPHSRRCVSCGTQLGQTPSPTSCPACNAPTAPGAAFCGNCGQRLKGSDTCARCGATLPPDVKFCPKCGNRRS